MDWKQAPPMILTGILSTYVVIYLLVITQISKYGVRYNYHLVYDFTKFPAGKEEYNYLQLL